MNNTYLKTNSKKTIHDLQKKLESQDNVIFELKNLIDNIPGDVYWKDQNGIWMGLNKRCVESLQRMGFIKKADENEVIGKNDYQLFEKITADTYRAHDVEVMEKKHELSVEEKTKLSSGEEVILLSTKRPLLDRQGNAIGIIG